MSEYEIVNARFSDLILRNARVQQLFSGGSWCEGPVWFGDLDCLLFSDIPGNRILRWIDGAGISVFRAPSNFANGHTRDLQGRLISCEHGSRRLTRTEYDGTLTVLIDRHRSSRLNSPNDVAVRRDGTIWFTDPPYGILTDWQGYRAESEQEGNFVFRLDPATGELTAVANDFDRPNGIGFSPDDSTLYVSDTGGSGRHDGPPHIRAFDVSAAGTLTNPRLFAAVDQGKSDGFCFDREGNLWSSAGDGVHCFSPGGELLGKIRIPETVSNVAFGGIRRNRLFITAGGSLYSVFVAANGALEP